MQKKLVPVNTDKLYELITLLEADIVKLKTEESYQKHDPQYYDYVVYYEDLAETESSLLDILNILSPMLILPFILPISTN